MEGYFADTPDTPIYQAESISVLTALHWGLIRGWRKLLIYTDSMNTVDLYASHRPTPELRPILRIWSLLLLKYKASVRVLHIAGTQNVVADALSRGLLDTAIHNCPKLRIHGIAPLFDARGGFQSK